MKTEHVLSLTKAWRYLQNMFFRFCKDLRLLSVELHAIKILFVSLCECFWKSAYNTWKLFSMFWEKKSSLDLNHFFKENAQIITCSTHFSILVLLNVNEVLKVLLSIEVVFHFNLPDPCAVVCSEEWFMYSTPFVYCVLLLMLFGLVCFVSPDYISNQNGEPKSQHKGQKVSTYSHRGPF